VTDSLTSKIGAVAGRTSQVVANLAIRDACHPNLSLIARNKYPSLSLQTEGGHHSLIAGDGSLVRASQEASKSQPKGERLCFGRRASQISLSEG